MAETFLREGIRSLEKGKYSEKEPNIKELNSKMGQLAMENVFLSIALGHIAEPGAKK